jgi:hypothetical protein
VEWYAWDKDSKSRGEFISAELFDHDSDPGENQNMAADPSHADIVKSLSQQLNLGWKHALPE